MSDDHSQDRGPDQALWRRACARECGFRARRQASMLRSWATTAPANRPSCARSPRLNSRPPAGSSSMARKMNLKSPIEAREVRYRNGVRNSLWPMTSMCRPICFSVAKNCCSAWQFSILDYPVNATGHPQGAGKDCGQDPTSRNTIRKIAEGNGSALQSRAPQPSPRSSSSWTNRQRRFKSQRLPQVENIIHNLKQSGEPLILISHNMRQVFDLVDRIVVFRRAPKMARNSTKIKPAARKSSPTLPEPRRRKS